LLLGLLAAALLVPVRQRLFSFAVLWFFLHLALESSVLSLMLVFEHRTYLPLVVPCFALAWGIVWLFAARPRLAALAATALVAVLTLATVARNEVWRDNERLWRDVVRKSPGSPRAHSNLGVILADRGRHLEAIAEHERALALDPSYDDALHSLGASLMALGRLEESLASYREAVRLDPDDPLALGGLASVELRAGDAARAVEFARRSIAVSPDPRVVHILARAEAAMGNFVAARDAYRATLAINPTFAPAYSGLGLLLLEQGRAAEGVAMLDRSLAIAASAEAHVAMARAAWSLGNEAAAIGHARAALALGLADEFANDVAWMFATAERPEHRDVAAALRLSEAALANAGAADPSSLDTRAAALARAERYGEAAVVARDASRLARESDALALAAEIESRAELYEAGRAYQSDRRSGGTAAGAANEAGP
jgi:tetratricopeptide (TPR) repeat protein